MICTIMKWLLVCLIHFYRIAISPFIGNCCRFLPTCSEYGLEAVKKHGAVKGAWLAAKRVCRCHPFRKGGYDPVP